MEKQSGLIAGVDEVGRGAFFGDIVAAAVILPLDQLSYLRSLGVKDSKRISPKKRETLSNVIKDLAVDYAFGFASSKEIDKIGINNANDLCMMRAIESLNNKPSLLLVDGINRISISIPQKCTPQGEDKHLQIAAASIIAKVYRDTKIVKLATTYPEYDLHNNKGYGTVTHRQAIKKYGVTDLHRLSFLKNLIY